MLTKIVKWVSMAALLLTLLGPSSAGYRILLAFCAGAILAVQLSAGAGMICDDFLQGEVLHLKRGLK